MKKILLGFTIVLSISTLVGCSGYDTGEYVHDGAFKVVGDKGNYDVLKDTETGCLYLEPHHNLRTIPYYGEDGFVKGCGEGSISDY